MKGAFEFDPMKCDYGPATAAVRQILMEWADIDWFAPPTSPIDDATAHALKLFHDHAAMGWIHQPDLFPVGTELTSEQSTWAEFSALCTRVRDASSTWDWKFSVLKKLSFEHSQQRGWNLRDEAQWPPPPGALFMRLGAEGEHAVWTGASTKLDWSSIQSEANREIAQWYSGYATMDIIEALEWQLAEKSDTLDGNPFVPLLRCYAAGFYPFSLGQMSMRLFAFKADT